MYVDKKHMSNSHRSILRTRDGEISLTKGLKAQCALDCDSNEDREKDGSQAPQMASKSNLFLPCESGSRPADIALFHTYLR